MENKEPSIKLNFGMNAILTLTSIIFPIISFPYVSRVLLPEGTGKVSFAVSLITYFVMLSQLGIPTYGIRACARVRDDKEELSRVTHELLFISLIMSLISYILLFALIFFVPRLYSEKTLYYITRLMIIFSAIGAEWLYKGLEQYTFITIRAVVCKVISLIAMFLLIRERGDHLIYGEITVFAGSAPGLINFICAGKYISYKPVGGYNIKRHLKPVMIFFA
ncbi:MAG: oligosaccharide flippase family protein, partial [Lachnospiraceae bacterium]|nr:oligosaccharide flippase family protein [Lachnospiraceae bacterium]